MDLFLKEKKVLVTGSTSGIGKATARLLAQEGATALINGRREEKVQQVIKEIQSSQPEASLEPAVADLSSKAGCNEIIQKHPEVDIYETDYYKKYQSLINNRELHQLLEESDLQLVFYLHHNMQKYAFAFSTPCSHIKIVQEGEQWDIQELLKSSAILITDYSSVHFDFAYMGKPVIYYQFDKETFFSIQYKAASFDAERDGFGRVIYHEDELVNQIKETYLSGAVLEGRYLQNMRNFYQLYDRNNCDRVYKAIKSM